MRFRLWLLLVLSFAACSDSDAQRWEFLSMQWEANGASNNVRFCEIIATGQGIALDPEIVVGLRDIRSAHVTRDEEAPTYSVVVTLTPNGRRRLEDESSRHIGRRLAIVLDDDVVGLATVMRPLDATELPLMPTADESTAAELADRINEALEAS